MCKQPVRWVWTTAAIGVLVIPELTVIAPNVGLWPVEVVVSLGGCCEG